MFGITYVVVRQGAKDRALTCASTRTNIVFVYLSTAVVSLTAGVPSPHIQYSLYGTNIHNSPPAEPNKAHLVMVHQNYLSLWGAVVGRSFVLLSLRWPDLVRPFAHALLLRGFLRVCCRKGYLSSSTKPLSEPSLPATAVRRPILCAYDVQVGCRRPMPFEHDR